MKQQIISLQTDFADLLQKLGPKRSNASLLAGTTTDGWEKRIAWNPCDIYTLENSEKPDESFFEFINHHQVQKHLIVGFLSYDLGYDLHGIKKTADDKMNLPNAVILAYDNYLEADGENIYAKYTDADFIEEISKIDTIKLPRSKTAASRELTYNWDRNSYKKAFERIKNDIYEGVVYQINLTQELELKSDVNSRAVFDALAKKNIGKMMAYFETDDFQITSMSPERFIRTQGNDIFTTPIKGTRARGSSKKEDEQLEQDLVNSEKEKAELNMITDLLRNDLGKVCQAGSIKVKIQREIERLTSVMHTFSTIQGRLADNISPVQALISMFPGGSVTGCPKRKAMEIIDTLEPSSRGAYCGSIFCIDDKGDLDSSILIRTLVQQKDRLTLNVGSGIVDESVENREYQENLDKARSLLESL